MAKNSANGEAKLILLSSLVNREDNKGLQEATELLDQDSTKKSIDPNVESRLRAVVLFRKGKPEDLEAAIKLLQQSAAQKRKDKLCSRGLRKDWPDPTRPRLIPAIGAIAGCPTS